MNHQPFSRGQLEVWRSGHEWCHQVEQWMDELRATYGKPAARLRRRETRHAKELGDEVWPLAKWLSHNADVKDWEARFCPPGGPADAHLRMPGSCRYHSLQIVTTLDGKLFAREVHQLNSRGRTCTVVVSGKEDDDQHAQQVVQRIESKSGKGYPPDFWLLVALEDRVRTLPELDGTLHAAQVAARKSPFDRVYLVGMLSGETFRAR